MYFLLFIFFIVANLVYNATLTVWSIYFYVTLESGDFDDLKWDHLKSGNFNVIAYNVFYVFGIVVNLTILVLFGVPTLILFVVHSINFTKNMTTNE